jgi:hypothetical protein
MTVVPSSQCEPQPAWVPPAAPPAPGGAPWPVSVAGSGGPAPGPSALPCGPPFPGWGPGQSAAPSAPSPYGPPAPGSVAWGPGPSAAPSAAPSPCGPPVPGSVAWGPGPSAAPSAAGWGAAPSAPLPYGPPAVHGSVSAGWGPVPPPPAGPPPPTAQVYGLTVDSTLGSEMWPDCILNKEPSYGHKLPKPCCPAYLLLTKGDPEKDELMQIELDTFRNFVDAENSRNPRGAPYLANNVFQQTQVGAPVGPEGSPDCCVTARLTETPATRVYYEHPLTCKTNPLTVASPPFWY